MSLHSSVILVLLVFLSAGAFDAFGRIGAMGGVRAVGVVKPPSVVKCGGDWDCLMKSAAKCSPATYGDRVSVSFLGQHDFDRTLEIAPAPGKEAGCFMIQKSTNHTMTLKDFVACAANTAKLDSLGAF